jgi:FGGY family of carbohydrate kinases, N-terminal domain
VVWELATGKAVCPAISWRDSSGAAARERLRAAGHEELIRQRTGLPLEAAFSASKLRWVLDEVPGARAAAGRGELLFGDINCWLTWNLSGGVTHVTEPSMAARTMLFDLSALAWDAELLDLFGIPSRMLPAVLPTAGRLAVTDPDVLGGRAVVAAAIGDQQGALFGQRCWAEGMAKLTLGTGAFFWCTRGRRRRLSYRRASWPAARGSLLTGPRTRWRDSCRTRAGWSPGCAGSGWWPMGTGRASGESSPLPGCGACPRCSGLARPGGDRRRGRTSPGWTRRAPGLISPRPP